MIQVPMSRGVTLLQGLTLLLTVALQTCIEEGSRQGSDWPQWRGPNRDAIAPPAAFQPDWPVEGLPTAWRTSLGTGFSAVSVSGSRLFTLFQEGDSQFLVALDAGSNRELWRIRFGSPYQENPYPGPKSTPAVDSGVVYALGARGTLVAVGANTGRVEWSRHLIFDLAGWPPVYGYSTSPVVEGDLVIVEPGGGGTTSLVALNKRTGELAWKAATGPAAYSSPIVVEIDGNPRVVHLSASHLVLLDAKTGRILWKAPWKTPDDENVATPIFIPPNRVFISTRSGSAVFELGPGSGRHIWKNQSLTSSFSSPVYFDRHLYGSDSEALKCIDADTGHLRWAQALLPEGSLVLSGSYLLVLTQSGELVAVTATPHTYREIARMKALDGRCWTPPSISGGYLYLRNEKHLLALNLISP